MEQNIHQIAAAFRIRLVSVAKASPAQVFVPPFPKHTTLAPRQILYCSIGSAQSILWSVTR